VGRNKNVLPENNFYQVIKSDTRTNNLRSEKGKASTALEEKRHCPNKVTNTQEKREEGGVSGRKLVWVYGVAARVVIRGGW